MSLSVKHVNLIVVEGGLIKLGRCCVQGGQEVPV